MSLDQTSLARRQACLMITGCPGSLIHCDSSYTAIPGWKTLCTLQIRHWPREVENIGCAGRSASHDNAKPTAVGRKLMTSTYWQNSTNFKCCLTVNKRIYAPDQSCNMYQKDSRNPSRCFMVFQENWSTYQWFQKTLSPIITCQRHAKLQLLGDVFQPKATRKCCRKCCPLPCYANRRSRGSAWLSTTAGNVATALPRWPDHNIDGLCLPKIES